MENKCIGLYGPTGSGKTTFLNQLVQKYEKKNRISYSFQDNQLLENLTVYKNIELPLENIKKRSNNEDIINYWLHKLDLQEKIHSSCKKLSGGEKQRVNLCRAFAYDGELFLLDEPFSAQDEMHKNIIVECVQELKNREKNIYIVSHNKQDLLNICDEILEFPLVKDRMTN